MTVSFHRFLFGRKTSLRLLGLLGICSLPMALIWLSSCASPTVTANSDTKGSLASIKLPAGFKIDYFARDVPNARSLAVGPNGIVFVGTRRKGDVYAVVDENGDFKADRVHRLATGLHMPNGVAFRDGSLYVAEVERVLRFDRIAEKLSQPPKPVVINDDFPSDDWHGWKFIRFGPDGRLFVPVGAPCNVCVKEDPYATILSMKADGSDLKVFARGVRNTVGFDWHPKTNELWFTDNGRDWLGDDSPPDELNRAEKAGMHFGFPYCHAGEIVDPEFGKRRNCDEFVAPARKLGPHVAAIGMRFYTGEMFPAEYRNQILIAEHGSWNRSRKLGYRVMLVRNDGKRATSYEVFAEGWLDEQEQEAWGRPADVALLPDGSILVSDDKANAIYRISYEG